MSILSKIKTGRAPRAQKVVIYAPEGFGKSTIASQFPGALFLDVEESTSQMDVARLGREDLPTLASVEQALAAIVKERACQTVVIDTIDWLEAMVLEAMIKEAASDKIQGIEDFGYGKGYTILKEKVTLLLARIDAVIQGGINVVLLAHSKVVKFEPPDGAGPYDRYELKLSKQVAPLIKEWADMLLFGNFRTQVKERDKNDAGAQYKGVGGKDRVMYCVRAAAWDAKNRHEMKDVEKWDIAVIEAAFKTVGAAWGNAPGKSADIASTAKPSASAPTSTKPGKPAAGAAATSPKDTTGSAPDAAAATTAGNTPLNASASPSDTMGQMLEAVTGVPVIDVTPSDLPRSADPIPGIEQPENEDAELAALIGGQEKLVNAWLIKNRHVTQDQTYRSCPADIRKRMLKNWDGFLKVAVAQAGKEAA